MILYVLTPNQTSCNHQYDLSCCLACRMAHPQRLIPHKYCWPQWRDHPLWFDSGILILVLVFPNHLYPGLSLVCRGKIWLFWCLYVTSSLSTIILSLLNKIARSFILLISLLLQSHIITYLLLLMLLRLIRLLQKFWLIPLYNFLFQYLSFHSYIIILPCRKSYVSFRNTWPNIQTFLHYINDSCNYILAEICNFILIHIPLDGTLLDIDHFISRTIVVWVQ